MQFQLLAAQLSVKTNYSTSISSTRGATVEWLEQLGYGAESR